MRIISGLAGGIRLNAPEGRGIRPTEDRVKESMFSTLGDLRGKVVVDLFAGTGALGLEALSRGASQVVFVEYDKTHVKFIEQNLAAVLKSMNGHAGETQIICADAKNTPALLANLAGKVSFLLADPPYAEDKKSYGACALAKDLKMAQWAGPDCILMLEHASDNLIPWHPITPWDLIKYKKFGIRALSFARNTENPSQA